MADGPAEYFKHIMDTSNATAGEAYRATVEQFHEPLYSNYGFCRKNGEYAPLSLVGKSTPAITEPSDIETDNVPVISIPEEPEPPAAAGDYRVDGELVPLFPDLNDTTIDSN